MNPQKDQLVEIRFNNGLYLKGIVENWTDEKTVLRLDNTKEVIIIQNTRETVLLVKIVGKEKAQQKQTISTEFEELKEQPKTDYSLKRMAELKDEMNRLEKEEILRKARSHEASGTRNIEYGIPLSLITKHSQQKTTPKDNGFGAELQALFGKRDKISR